MSDDFERANQWEELVITDETWIDEEGVEWEVGNQESMVIRGLLEYQTDNDGDLLFDGEELLELTPLMFAAGKPRFDPSVNESTRDDDGDGIPSITEYLFWGTDPLNPNDPDPETFPDPDGNGELGDVGYTSSTGSDMGGSGGDGDSTVGESGDSGGGGDSDREIASTMLPSLRTPFAWKRWRSRRLKPSLATCVLWGRRR